MPYKKMDLTQKFVEKYSHHNFQNAEKLFTRLREMVCEVSVSKSRLSCFHYGQMYKSRAKWLYINSKENVHPIYNDFVRLSEVLLLTPNEDCLFWRFKFSDKTFVVFEVVELNQIAGCFFFATDPIAQNDGS